MKNRGLEHFAEWTKWDGCMEQDRDWQRLIHEDDQALFRFEIAATEDQLPTPSVLCCWEILTKEQAVCPVCKVKQGTLKHILSSCNSGANSALHQGRYTWRHDSILLALFQHIRSLMHRGRAVLKLGLKQPPHQIKFASDKGNRISTRSVEAEVPLFEQSDDWVLQFDLDYKKDGQRKNAPLSVQPQ